MYKPGAIAVAALFVSLTACTEISDSDQTPTAEPVPVITPLKNLYDTIWIQGSDGSIKTLAEVADDLSRYDVVFFGEFHGHSGIHLAQMQLFEALHERYPDTTLSLEQFERDTQALVDSYLAGEIGEKVLQEDGRGWANYEQSYRPLVEYARDNQLPVVAANAPKSAVICVGRKGADILEEMPMPDRGWVAAELHLDEGAYWDKYVDFVTKSSTHGGDKTSETAEADDTTGTEVEMSEAVKAMVLKSFTGQVLRDDTMAESIAMHLQDNPGRKVFHLDGNFHSASHLGTVERLKLRMPELKIAVINPIAVEDNSAPAWTEEDAATGDYILLVREVPEMFVDEDKEKEFERKTMKKRMSNKCVYAEEQDSNQVGET